MKIVGTTPEIVKIAGTNGIVHVITAYGGDLTVEEETEFGAADWLTVEGGPITDGTTRGIIINTSAVNGRLRLTATAEGTKVIINQHKNK